MRRLLLAGAILSVFMAMVSVGWATINLNSSKSNIYKEFQNTVLVTATVGLTGASQTHTVHTTPAKGDFILTQLCVSPVNGGIRLAAGGFGPIAHTGNDLCYTFSPGMVMPQGSEMTCSTTSAADPGDYFCTIASLLR